MLEHAHSPSRTVPFNPAVSKDAGRLPLLLSIRCLVERSSVCASFPVHVGAKYIGSGRGNRSSLFAECLRHAGLVICRLIHCYSDRHAFRVRRRAIVQQRFSSRNLPKRHFAAGLVQLLESIETVSAIAHQLTGLGPTAQLLRELQQSHLPLDDLFRIHTARPPMHCLSDKIFSFHRTMAAVTVHAIQ